MVLARKHKKENNMKKQISKSLSNVRMLILSVFLFVVLTSFVSAVNSLTFNSPSNAGTINGTLLGLNASLDTNSANITNISYYYRNNSGAGDWTLIAEFNISDSSIAIDGFNTTFDTTSLYDTFDLEFNVTTRNSTGTVMNWSLIGNITIDNGRPTATLSTNTITNTDDIRNPASFIIGLASDTTIGIRNCTVNMNGVKIDIISSNNVSCEGTFIPSNFSITSEGNYAFNVTAIDGGSNITNSTSRVITIYFSTNVGGLGGAASSVVIQPEDAEVEGDVVSPDGTTQTTVGTGAPSTEGNFIMRFFRSIGDFFRRLFTRG